MNGHELKLVGDKVGLIFLSDLPDFVESPLLIPETYIATTRFAEVKFVGSQLSEPNIKVGSKVLVKIYDSSPKIKFNGDDLRLYDTKNIIALLLS